MVGKFYAIKDEKSINTGTVISTLFAIVISGGCYFLGGFGRLFDAPELHDEAGNMIFDGIIPHMLSTLPDILIGIVVVLVLSASMSTLASLVLTSSSTLTLDFLKDNVVKDMSEKKQVRTRQVMVVFFIVLSVVIAMDPPTFIAQLMGISWGALGRSVPGTIHVWSLLERRDKSRCMGQLCGRCRDYGSESVLPLYCITDQCRSSCNGSRTDRSTGSECAYTKA